MGPYGSENFKVLLLPQLWFLFNQIFSKYSLWQSSRKLLIGILKFQFFFSLKNKLALIRLMVREKKTHFTDGGTTDFRAAALSLDNNLNGIVVYYLGVLHMSITHE